MNTGKTYYYNSAANQWAWIADPGDSLPWKVINLDSGACDWEYELPSGFREVEEIRTKAHPAQDKVERFLQESVYLDWDERARRVIEIVEADR